MKFRLIIFFLLLSFAIPLPLLSQQEEKLFELKKKIEEERKAIDDLTKTEKNITLTLAQIGAKIKEIKKQIGEIEQNKAKVEEELNRLYNENQRLKDEIEIKREEIAKRLITWHKTYLLKPATYFGMDLKSSLLFENYMRYIFQYDRSLFTHLKNSQQTLLKNLERIKLKKQELASVEKELKQKRREQEAYESLERQRLAKTKKEKVLHQERLKKAEAALRKLEEILFRAEKVPEYTGKGLSKGILPYPVSGKIVGHFGKEIGEVKGAIFLRKGVEIETRDGAEVRAVDSGRVVYTGWIKNLGNVCIISHGRQFYTVYGRLSSITKSKNDEVKQGEIIGRVGAEASFFDFPTLYFEIRKGNNPLNPEEWLR